MSESRRTRIRPSIRVLALAGTVIILWVLATVAYDSCLVPWLGASKAPLGSDLGAVQREFAEPGEELTFRSDSGVDWRLSGIPPCPDRFVAFTYGLLWPTHFVVVQLDRSDRVVAVHLKRIS